MLSLKKHTVLILLTLLFIAIPADSNSFANGRSNEDELLMSFTYPSVGRVFVLGLYDYEDGQMLLPVIELFDMLGINMQVDRQSGTLSGTYLLGGNEYVIDFKEYYVKVGEKKQQYSAEELEVRALDYYMSLNVFEDMFSLIFSYNINNLSVSLDTPFTMPVVDKTRREEARKRIQDYSVERSFYPLAYNRERSLFRAGFLDYNIGMASNIQNLQQDYSFQLVGGVEALGGELRIRDSFGYSSERGWFNRYGNINWRYSVRDRNAFSSVQLGQLNTRGLQSQQINGFALTNNPIEPMQLYGESVFDGTTQPDSEVELYLNNELIDFTVSDAQGYYRFNVPLRYGTTNLRTQVYTRDGRLMVNERAILVPFNFVPKGRFIYNVQGGSMVNDGNPNNYGESLAGNADVSYGVSNWLTTKVGVEYNDVDLNSPLMYGSATARMFQEYLLNIDVVPNYFYRAQTSAVFSSNQSYSAAFTYFDGPNRYNIRGAEYQFQANIYSPLPLRFFNSGIRISVDHAKLPLVGETRMRSDLFSQLGPVNVRLNYSDRLLSTNDGYNLIGGMFTGSLTYQFNRRSGFNFLNGSFLRGTVMYSRLLRNVQQYDVHLSKTIMGNGQFLIGLSRFTASSQSFLQVGLSLDLGGKMRSATTGRSNFRNTTINQNLRGSIGYDDRFNSLQVIDRQQVGKSAASLVLFIDNDNDAEFSDGDEIIPYAAVKLDRPAIMKVDKDGVVRLSQLLSNFRYNIQIDRNAIPNPLYVPTQDKFSFVADPHQFKTIEIPFYKSGVIEGTVYTDNGTDKEGLGGLRLQIHGKNGDYYNEIRSFRGGSFYAMDVPPGQYYIQVDTTQTDFLGAKRKDGILHFEVKATAEGDYINNLNIVLHTDKAENEKAEVKGAPSVIPVIPAVPAAKAQKDRVCREGYEFGIKRYPLNKKEIRVLRMGSFTTLADAQSQIQSVDSSASSEILLQTVYDFVSKSFWNILQLPADEHQIEILKNEFNQLTGSAESIEEILERHPRDGWLFQNCMPALDEAYYIQIGAFRDKDRAHKLVKKATPVFEHYLSEVDGDFQIVIKENDTFHKVLVGPIPNLDIARLLLTRFPADYEDAFIRLNKGVRN